MSGRWEDAVAGRDLRAVSGESLDRVTAAETRHDNTGATNTYDSPTTHGESLRSYEYDRELEVKGRAMSASSEQAQVEELEAERVARWRSEQFRSLGFDEEEASLLVASGADLHLTRSLVESGCPRDLAFRIVT